MATLGKCLLFWLKYTAEMERLYEADEPNVEGLPDADRNLERVRLVGDVACREGAELLEACAPGIEEHFRVISTVERVRNNLENNWELRFHVAPKRVTGKRFGIGVFLDVDRAALMPLVWCRGGRRAEDEMIRVLGRGTKGAVLGWGSGTVCLREIKISIREQLKESVGFDSLVVEVQQTFASFTAQEIKAIAAIASRRGEA